VQHTLETTLANAVANPADIPLMVKDYEGGVSMGNSNPYFLPWAMRGLLEEEFVRKTLKGEVEELLRLFEEWRPTSKALKDIRYRLEVLRKAHAEGRSTVGSGSKL
jgi:hypothetical protein